MSYLFLKSAQNKKVAEILKLLEQENPKLFESVQKKLSKAESDFIEKLVEKDPELMTKFKGFLKKKKNKVIADAEVIETDKRVKDLESLIDEL